ncbi:MAG TPA: hypothetical protein VJ891_11505 [Casimicrobiaceae bacterium]|nr:hypothetical protein [Casimicrobiaceae bacterium]
MNLKSVASIAAVAAALASASATTAATLAEAVEYFHPQFEHYFVTADPGEIAVLDQGTIPGWWRTGQRYRVRIDGDAKLAPVCRFYAAAFDGKASHFYTASTSECEYVKHSLREWTFEGIVFYAQLPDASGACASGSTPAYRLYNNGRGGAPNHAYTVDPAKRDLLQSEGWIAEGAAWCVPLAIEDPVTQTTLLAGTTWELPFPPSVYDVGSVRTRFGDHLVKPPSWYGPLSGLVAPSMAVYHSASDAWGGYGYFDPFTGRFIVDGGSGFDPPPIQGQAWELEAVNGPTSAVCTFNIITNYDTRYPGDTLGAMLPHPFQPVLWSGCMQAVAKKL